MSAQGPEKTVFISYNYGMRGRMYLKRGDAGRALDDLTKAIRLKPRAWYYETRGKANEALGNVLAASNDYRAAIKAHDPKGEDTSKKRDAVESLKRLTNNNKAG
jgi:tetratricopeptide (TPR) repeat protein